MHDDQEKINLREFVPDTGLVPEVIPSKLFLDTVPNCRFSCDVTKIETTKLLILPILINDV